jgi:hypothetical protein
MLEPDGPQPDTLLRRKSVGEDHRSRVRSPVELKVNPQYDRRDEAQLLKVLKATGIKLGLLVNFGRTNIEHKRLIFRIRVSSVAKKTQRCLLLPTFPHCVARRFRV